MPQREFAGQSKLQEYAARNGLEYLWEGTRTFTKWQRLLSPEWYEIVEVICIKLLTQRPKKSVHCVQTPSGNGHARRKATARTTTIPIVFIKGLDASR
jgi:hypothetical protein